MSDQEQDQVIVVPRSDPVFSVFVWRSDSITLTRLRPVLNQLRNVPDQPCLEQWGPYTCTNYDLRSVTQLCASCQLREIKTQLFGDPTTNHQGEQP